ncbi:DDE Tnp 1-like zinc-ribbon [Popillia japonica]|uniref:DDE Tnp 1-like zinc-ribbon n=1 Tax=Popillia japonica TaxID=7064 RepID=A0AAW1KS76_POPJA
MRQLKNLTTGRLTYTYIQHRLIVSIGLLSHRYTFKNLRFSTDDRRNFRSTLDSPHSRATEYFGAAENFDHSRATEYFGAAENFDQGNARLTEQHFPQLVPRKEGKKSATRRYRVCSQTKAGPKKRKERSYMCRDCDVGLCAVPCFKIYRQVADF